MPEVKLPNIRKQFIPDNGYIICDADLSGADAQEVAWQANDEDLKNAFKRGIKVHQHNAEAMFGPGEPGRKHPRYADCKRAVHGTNYGGSARTIAITLGWRVSEAERFQRDWFRLHPGIKEWHRRTEYDLQTTRTVRNKFGFRIVYFDRPDNLLPKALAWIPQSTVAVVCRKGGYRLMKALPWVEILLQVHDSLVFQIPVHKSDCLNQLREPLHVTVPHDDPLVIPWELRVSDKSWGHCDKLEKMGLEW